jgi:hypothetical protein
MRCSTVEHTPNREFYMAENNKMPPNQDQRSRAPQSSDQPQKPAANPSKPGIKPDDGGIGGSDSDRQGVHKPGTTPGKPNMNPNKPGMDPDRDRMGTKMPGGEKGDSPGVAFIDDDEAATQRVNRE